MQALLGAGADLDAKDSVRPPRRRRASAAARRRSLTRNVRRAAAASDRLATPPSAGPAATGTRRSCRHCWTRGQASQPRTTYAPAPPPPRARCCAPPCSELRPVVSQSMSFAPDKPSTPRRKTSSFTMRRQMARPRRSRSSWLRAPIPTGTGTGCVLAPAPPRCRPSPHRCHAHASCAALTTRTVPLLHLAGWQHRPHQGQLPRPHGDRASAARRRGKLQRQGQRTPAPPAPRTRCCALALAHPPCAPRRCPT